jgi:hypothetical protein
MILLLCSLALVASGCKKRTVRAAPPAVDAASPAEPMPQPPVPPPEKQPESPPESNPASPALVVPPAKPAPAKPAPPKPAAPQISPRLTPEEQAEAERRTNEDINVAEQNLQLAYGKQLNAAQHDLVEKILGFLGQARESIRASDWVRARNLAQKARVLSVELVNSL